MLELLSLGNLFLSQVSGLHEWFMSKPLDWLADPGYWEGLEAWFPLVSPLAELTVAHILLGVGITTILSLKVVKFILDCIPFV